MAIIDCQVFFEESLQKRYPETINIQTDNEGRLFTPLESPAIYGGANMINFKVLTERAWFKATFFLTGFAFAANAVYL